MPKSRKPEIAHSPLAGACADAFIRLTESYAGKPWQDLYEAVALEVPDATSEDIQAGLALAILRTEATRPENDAAAEADIAEPPPTVH